MTLADPVLKALDSQADACALLGSAFSARVLRLAAARADAGGALARLLDPWREADLRRIMEDVMPLRLLGGLHYLTLAGQAPGLEAFYPPKGEAGDDGALADALAAAAEARFETLATFMASAPQTNEVRRSLCLLGGFLTVAAETGLPLRCLEIGASGGLNLNWDRYRYALGEHGAWGDAGSPVRLDAAWSGGSPPLDAPVRVDSRAGCDLRPIDLASPEAALRLQAYVWPNQPDRLARLRSAIDVARRHPPPVERADAGAWAADHVRPRAGRAVVLFHSVVWQYLPGETQARVADAVAAAGAEARSDSPFAWLRMEPDPDDPTGPMQVRLTLWPGGEARILASVHPHGAMVHWR